MRATVSRLHPIESVAAADIAGLPPAAPLARCLAEVAEAFMPGRRLAPDLPEAVSPEAIAALADDLALQSSYRQARAAQLQSGDFPAIVLLKSGLARIVTARDGRRYRGLCDGAGYDMDEVDLAMEEAGTIFLPRPRAASASTEAAQKREAPQRVGLVGALVGHMLTTHRAALFHLLAAAALGNLLLVALPLFTMAVYDRVIPHSARETLWALSIGVGLALLIDLALRYVRIKLSDALALSSGLWLQARLFRHLTGIEMSRAPRNAGGFAAQMREADGIAQVLPQVLTGVLVDLPFLVVIFAILAGFGGPVAFVPLAGIAVLALVHLITANAGRAAAKAAAALQRQQANLVVDTIGELETVKAAAAEPQTIERFERLADEAAYAGHLGRLWAGIGAYANLTIGQLIIVAVVVVSVYQIGDGLMTVGALSASTLLVGRTIGPVGQLLGLWHRARQIGESLGGLEGFLAAPAETAGRDSIPTPVPARAPLALRSVHFAYPGSALNRLTDVSMTVQPGEKVALIGRSGSGKSTLLKLMVRLHAPDRGSVLYDDTDIAQFAPRPLRERLGYMRQEPALVDDTLLANITLGTGTLDRDRFEAACRIAGVRDFAARQPEGYGLKVGPRGERLSGGERQSVALARLLYRDPAAFILDEPTSAMDTILEARVVRDLRAALDGRTLVLATHRAPLLTLVDRLIWLDDGRVRADGPKAEVLERLGRAAG